MSNTASRVEIYEKLQRSVSINMDQSTSSLLELINYRRKVAQKILEHDNINNENLASIYVAINDKIKHLLAI
jgi:hypothetical protein